MKTIKFLTIAFLLVLSFGVTSCSKQEDDAAQVVRETVYCIKITSLSPTLTLNDGTKPLTVSSEPYKYVNSKPTITGTLASGATYGNVKIVTYIETVEGGVIISKSTDKNSSTSFNVDTPSGLINNPW